MSDITANVLIAMPSQPFTMARAFKAVANGEIFIGLVDTDPTNPANQIQVYIENEDGTHVPVPQPLRINAGGFPVYNGQIVKFVTVQNYSMEIRDSYGTQQFYFADVLKYAPDQLRAELAALGGAALVGPGVMSRGLDKFSILQGRPGEKFGDDITRGIGVHLAEPITGSGLTVNTAKFNYIRIDDDRFNAVDDMVPGTKVDGFLLNHKFGGAGCKGGRHAAEFILEQLGQTDATNTDRNYVGVTGFATSSTGDGGVSLAGAKGAYFGGNFYGTLTPGAMYTLNVTGAEFNVGIPEGASSNIRTGLQIGGTKAKRGDVIDAAISVGNMGSACTWRTGIAFGPQNGGAVFGEDSRVLSVDCPKIDRVLSLGSLVEVNHIIFHNLVKLSTKSLQLEDSGAFTSVGSPTIASTVQTIYRSSGAGSAFDARVVVSGGSATDGQGNYEIKAGIVTYNCTQRPSADNQFDYGSASYRGRTAYFGTGAINTSDDNHKPIKEAIPDVVLDAWEEVSWRTRFKFDDAVAQKGEDGARWHFGLIAQRVEEVFASHGIDGFGLGLLCYDEWEDQYISVRTNEGERVTKTRTVSRMMEVTKTRTVKRPVMMTATREILVDEETEDGERIKRVVQEEYQTPKLIQVFVFNEDGSPRLDEAGKQLFVYEAELEDVEEEYTEQVPTEVIEEYTEPAEPTYSQVLETPAGSRYGIRYEEALALEAALQRRNYERMKEQYENLVARVEDLESK
ncbi:tail fiber domain-containing protein [Escherichia coli]|nr:tail fiber domain-containing protein [Escherichia coli]ELO4872233.1 tail fiber domain-containing protein [Escherichia coli]